MILIEWQDSYSMDYWQSKNNAIANSKEPMTCRTIGFILDEGDDSVTVCHTVNEEDQVCGVIQIPKKCIVNKKRLKG